MIPTWWQIRPAQDRPGSGSEPAWYRVADTHGRILDDTDVVVEHRGSVTGEGTGRRVLRHWADHTKCCASPQILSIPDGRLRCHTCAMWYSASHSGPWTAGARSTRPVGIDIQVRRDRPAAMRWLAQTCSLTRPTLAHWVATEAVLKAAGQAHGLTWLTNFPLPDDLPQTSTVVLPGSGPATVIWGTWEDAYLAVAVIDEGTTDTSHL